MSDMMEYKCPACGGALAFDADSQKLKCPFCEMEYDMSEFEGSLDAGNGAETAKQDDIDWKVDAKSKWDAEDKQGIGVYSCKSCGGEIVCDETTASTSCPYCGNPVVFSGQIADDLKPDYIIPFKLDKKAAKEALKKHVKSKKLVPALFKDENHIDEIKGVYVPFWLFDAELNANVSFTGDKVRTWSDSDYKYIEHNYFQLNRAGRIAFDNVPVDGSEKMADDLMESIEPFNFGEAVDFKSGYLAGYMADKYDVDVAASVNVANERIKRSTEQAFRDTVNGYGSVITNGSFINMYNGNVKYALYPVWMLNTTWQGNTYTFAMNGQTGKFVGDLPLDKGAYWRKFGILSAALSPVCFGIATLVMWLL